MKYLPPSLLSLGAVALFSCTPRPAAQVDPYADPYAPPQPATPDYSATYPTAPAQPYPSTPATPYPSSPSPAAAHSSTTHTVQKGDTLWGLSRQYGTSVSAIQSANGLSSSTIVIGQSLTIPQ